MLADLRPEHCQSQHLCFSVSPAQSRYWECMIFSLGGLAAAMGERLSPLAAKSAKLQEAKQLIALVKLQAYWQAAMSNLQGEN